MAQKRNNNAKTANKLIAIATSLGWGVTPPLFSEENNLYMFSKFSPAGQDFNFEIEANDLIGNLERHIDGYDPSEEAYLWLDSTGHGKNGAPNRMIDVYNDMVACEEMMVELLKEWKKVRV